MPEQNREPGEAPASEPTGASGADAAPAAPVEAEALRQELDEARGKAREYLGLLQRAQADFVNYRRRVEQERGESILAGRADLAQRILPAIDDFDRAVQNRPAELADSQWVQGIELIGRKVRAALEGAGIVSIDALGQEFDPWEHEAVMQAPSSPEEAGRVIEVFRAGYKQGSKVLRPAQVKVGRGLA